MAVDHGGGAGPGARLFAVPRLLVGLAAGKCAPPDCESPAAARSPRSPLDLWAFPPALDGSLLRSQRSPRSWDSRRVGLGAIVDDGLAQLAAGANTNRLLGHQMRPSLKLTQGLAKSSCASEPRDCPRAPPELANGVVTAGAGGVPVPCSRSYGDLKSGPEPIVPCGAQLVASSLSAELAKFPTPESPPGRWYIRSVSATEVEQSEDYTCIIAHGPNPKTTRIFGDCILEPVTMRAPDGDSMEVIQVKEAAAESYWLVKCYGEVFSDSCMCYKEKLDGNDGCVYRGGDAFCTENCRDQKILVEKEEEKSTPKSSFSSSGSSSSLSDDTFMVGMVVLTGSVDTQLP